MRLRLRLLTMLLGLMTGHAYAVCTSPAGQTGDQAFNGTQNVMAYCDGTNWISMAGGVSVTIGGTTNNPGGSTGQVQYNGGSTFAGSSAFTYSSGLLSVTNISATGITSTNISTTNLTVNGVAITGNASGDRITSGTASAIANSSSGYISLTTGAITWGYLGSSATYLPNLNANTVSSTGGIKVGMLAATCASGISGTMRYNTASNTMEYCNGSAWANMGPSATTPVVFSVNKNGTGQTFANGTATKLTWASPATYDTNNNFDFTNNRYKPTVPGKYLITASAACTSLGTSAYCVISIYKNGTAVAENYTYSGPDTAPMTSTIVDMNGTSDYVEAYATTGAGGSVAGFATRTYFNGALLSPQGGGSGGTATPAGSTADVQFNSAGALAADTGLFTYASGVLKAPTVSTTNLSATTAMISSLGVGNVAASGNVSISGVVKIGTTAATCASGISGTMRYSATSSTMEYCNGSAWTSMGPSSTQPISFAVNKGGTNQTVAASNVVALTWSNELFDSNNNFASNRFTVTVPGKYLFTLNVRCNDGSACIAYIRKNGSDYAVVENDTAVHGVPISTIMDLGIGDYVDTAVFDQGGTDINGNVAHTSFSGVLLAPQGGGSGGTATPAGSTADVQFNSAGALAADTGLFTYASGVLKTPTISATNLSATTAMISSLGVGNVAASGNVSISGVVKIGTTAATCASGISGTIRYNTASNTMEYCNGSAWANMGPSSTQPIAFSVNRAGTTQVITAGQVTLLAWTNVDFDTNNNFNIATGQYKPTVPGKYIFSASAMCHATTNYCVAYIFKNNATFAMSQQAGVTGDTSVNVSKVIDMNGTTDYVDARVYNTATDILGYVQTTYFTGAMLSPQGGGSGGTATPAGTDTQLQFNSSGNFGASSNLTFDSSARNLAVSGSIQYGGTGSESCSSSADYGKNRRNPANGRMQVCLFR